MWRENCVASVVLVEIFAAPVILTQLPNAADGNPCRDRPGRRLWRRLRSVVAERMFGGSGRRPLPNGGVGDGYKPNGRWLRSQPRRRVGGLETVDLLAGLPPSVDPTDPVPLDSVFCEISTL